MNYTLKALIFTLFAASFPSMQAMRPSSKSLLAASRGGLSSALLAPRRTLTQSTEGNDHKEQSKDGAYNVFDSNFIGAGAVAAGLAMANQQSLEEKEKLGAVEKIDIFNVQLMSDIFKNGTEEQKRAIAERAAQKITKYSVIDISVLLEHAVARPHRVLVMAIAKNITSFTLKDIAQILKADAQEETHDLLASAFNKQYVYFMRWPVWGFDTPAIDQFAQFIFAMREQYRVKATRNLAQSLGIDCSQEIAGADFFALLSRQASHQQRLMVLIYFANHYNFNRGQMDDAIRTFIDGQRQLVYKEISKEWMISDYRWHQINQEFEFLKECFVKAQSQEEQFEYKIHVPDHIKEAIALICKKRGITEKIIIDSMPSNRKAVASASFHLTKDGFVHVLSLDLLKFPHSSKDEIQRNLEHEIGGHMRQHHSLLSCVLAKHISDAAKTLNRTFDPSEKNVSTSWGKLQVIDEYEADLLSAIEDDIVAQSIRSALEINSKARISWTRSGIYMSNEKFYRAIMAILYSKQAAQKWFDSMEAYNLYGPPAYDAFDYSDSAVTNNDGSDNLNDKKD